jgi:acetyl-CoA carboxylase beta subunit
VIRETIGRDLPKGFQSSEFLLEKGFLDDIVPRPKLRGFMIDTLDLLFEDVAAERTRVAAEPAETAA